jgi:hypothetical protein
VLVSRVPPTQHRASTTCLLCPLLRPESQQRSRLVELRDNLLARIAEEREHCWLDEVDGLQISLDGARQN